MSLPAATSRLDLVVPTADGVSVLGGSSAHPLYVSQAAGNFAPPMAAAGTAITDTTEASLLTAAAKFTLPANWWAVGRTIRITATGLISSVITTPGTARFRVYQGSVVVFDSLAILLATAAARTNTAWILEILLSCRAIGSGTSANLWGAGKWISDDLVGVATGAVADGVANLPWNSAPAVGTGFDSTIANVYDLQFVQTVATSGSSITCEQHFVELIGG